MATFSLNNLGEHVAQNATKPLLAILFLVKSQQQSDVSKSSYTNEAFLGKVTPNFSYPTDLSLPFTLDEILDLFKQYLHSTGQPFADSTGMFGSFPYLKQYFGM